MDVSKPSHLRMEHFCDMSGPCEHLEYVVSNGRMADELEEIWKEAVVVQTRYDPGIFLDGLRMAGGPCHSSGGYSLVSHRGGRGSSPGQIMWDLWTNGAGTGFPQVLRFPRPILIPPTAPHSSSSSIIRGWYNRQISDRRIKWTQVSPHPKKPKQIKNKKKKRDDRCRNWNKTEHLKNTSLERWTETFSFPDVFCSQH
jgi:hypothetical protein